MKTKIFYRVGSVKTNQGLWYDMNGNFTGNIHKEFYFLKNTNLQMPYNTEIVGYLSATKTLRELYFWFSKKEINFLRNYGFAILKYKANDYKQIDNHFAINQKTSKLIEIL